jgi:hypothetical protein
MNKIWWALAVLVLVIIAAVWLVVAPAPADDTARASEKRVFTWNITELGEHSSAPGIPRSEITLTTGGKTYPVGEFNGSCAEIDGTAWPLYEGEKTGVICWWAGGGSEVGVFVENGTLIVKEGDLDEGNAEIPGFRGNFRTILTLD